MEKLTPETLQTIKIMFVTLLVVLACELLFSGWIALLATILSLLK